MKIGVSLKINVSKIDKNRLFQGKNGNVYLDTTAFIDIDNLDQYGNSGMITQDVSKQERDSGVKGAILGNTKVFYNDSKQAPQQAPQQQGGFQQQQPPRDAQGFTKAQGGFQQAPKQQAPTVDFDGDIPF